ncbi:hypothetical protein MCC10091_2002 [Bifidobacterium longum subsp. longum]|nr:hypothetical protein MCC10091_2002 [Bifidobacterium longum subsp. longum]
MLIPSFGSVDGRTNASLSRRVNANSQQQRGNIGQPVKLIKKGEC